MPNTSPTGTQPLAAAPFPVAHSLLSSEALGRHLQDLYTPRRGARLRPVQHKLNDTYLIESTTGRYVLRVSRARPTGAGWRTRDDILFGSTCCSILPIKAFQWRRRCRSEMARTPHRYTRLRSPTCDALHYAAVDESRLPKRPPSRAALWRGSGTAACGERQFREPPSRALRSTWNFWSPIRLPSLRRCSPIVQRIGRCPLSGDGIDRATRPVTGERA